MKTLAILIGITLVAIIASTTFAEVETKDVPSVWQQTAVADGEELYLDLCAVCHGKRGLGDGPAASEMKNKVPDLTVLAIRNNGVFPRDDVEKSVAGDSRVASHGTVDMPIWGQMFEDERPDRKMFERKALANQRLYNLTEYLATIQAK